MNNVKMLCHISYKEFFFFRSMVTFKSVIVFDAETTSLPQLDHNTTKITELAFLGCEVEHLQNSKELPRVLHKLILLFNPHKTIHPQASAVSGLTNELLINVKPFSEEDVDILRQFIDRLPQPVCIVAHNGNKFDFPILRRAIEKVNKSLQDNLYCVDSIKAFKSLLPQKMFSNSTEQTVDNRGYKTPHKKTKPHNSLQYKHTCRELFPEERAFDESTKSQNDDVEIINPLSLHRFSYHLKDLYHFYYGAYFPDAHRAEEDSKALLSCIIQCKGFLNWMNENASTFNSIQPLS